MTLKKCTATQLDDTFWRVDFDGRLSVGGHDVKSPQAVKRFGECWFVQGYPHEDASGLDALLARLGLTRHDGPETAEERVRAYAAHGHRLWRDDDQARSDTACVLAELDAVRADYARLEEGAQKTVGITPGEMAEYAEWYAENGIPGSPSYHDAIRGFAQAIRGGAAERWVADGKPQTASPPETAEGRVRAWVDDACEGRETDWRHPADIRTILAETDWLHPADLRAVLAELDRLRDAYDAQSADLLRECRLSDDLKSALRMPGHGSYVEYAKEVRAELDRLREESEAAGARWHILSNERDMLAAKLSEQHLVDVDAVLAPVREALCLIRDHGTSVKRSLDTAYKNGCGAQGSDYRLLGYAYDLAAVHVAEALAEAEKIGRSEA